MGKKIKSCYYEVNGTKFLVGDSSEVLLEIGKDHKFYIDFQNDENFETEFTKEKRKTISTVKWAYIMQYSFSNLKKDNSKEDIWGYFIKENGSVAVENMVLGKIIFNLMKFYLLPRHKKEIFGKVQHINY